MRTVKLLLSMMALFVCALCTTNAVAGVNGANAEKLGVPYSLKYIAEHSKQRAKINSDNVIFHETASESGLSRSYDWHVTFEQNGYVVAEFSTNGSWSSWTVYSATDEVWNGSTAYVPPGTYTVRISDNSGYGNFYEMYANGVFASHDINTTREDGVIQNVVIDGSGSIDVGVNRVR